MPLVCGGSSSSLAKFCYFLGSDEVQATTIEPRGYTQPVVWDEGRTFWLSGVQRNTTEYLTIGQDPELGPAIPHRVGYHCAVKLDENRAMVLGGLKPDGDRTDKTWIFDRRNNGSYAPGPDLIEPMGSMACGLVHDEGSGSDIVVVVGGYNGAYSKSIQTWIVDSDEENFVERGFVPYAFCCAPGVVNGDGTAMYITGGYTPGIDAQQKSIMRIKCFPEYCEMTYYGREMAIPRYWGNAMLIPDSLVTCQ